MAEKKSKAKVTEEAEVTKAVEETEEADLNAKLAALEAELAKYKEAEEAAAQRKKERVPVFVPLIPGEDEDETVIINGVATKFKKGEWVEVPPAVKSVIDNKMAQENTARAKRETFKNFDNQRIDL